MELQHVSHYHPLVFHEEQCHASDQKPYCTGCGDLVLGPSFSCLACGFHLCKSCAKASSQIYHPFHRSHNLNLLASFPVDGGRRPFCNFCGKDCDNFTYSCSYCNINLHIKCASFSYYKIAQKNVGDLQICHVDPLITSFENQPPQELQKVNCFVCQKPLLNFAYLSPGSGFYLHEKCVQLPVAITHLSHRQHHLVLEFIPYYYTCQICKETQQNGLVYCCWPCNFLLHIDCVSPAPVIDDRSCHEHPFYRCFRQVPFKCDACGTNGDCVSYNCLTCSLAIHKKCISLPRFIKSWRHRHPMSHKYFVVDNDYGIRICIICQEVMDKNFGSYNCFECKSFIHVDCALRQGWYQKIESIDEYEKLHKELAVETFYPSFSVIRESKRKERVLIIEINHFSHEHNLVLSNNEVNTDRYCDACSLLIFSSFYHCLQCDFCLHENCVWLSMKKQVWFHQFGRHTQHLLSNKFFQCECCGLDRYGFAYKCEECLASYICIQCAESSLTMFIQGHQHPLHLDDKYDWKICYACGSETYNASIYRCIDCFFNVHFHCASLPTTVRHKCDQHYLTLTYREDNDYLESHYCDICEEKRIIYTWFYRCTICDTSTHLGCAAGVFPFIKPEIRICKENIHPHSLVTVKNSDRYSGRCWNCSYPCLDLALECEKTGCNYLIHWNCARNSIVQ